MTYEMKMTPAKFAEKVNQQKKESMMSDVDRLLQFCDDELNDDKKTVLCQGFSYDCVQSVMKILNQKGFNVKHEYSEGDSYERHDYGYNYLEFTI